MSFEIRPLSPRVGAEIVGLDLRAEIDQESAEGLRQVFRERHLLLIRQPDVSAADQRRFASLFGEVCIRYMRPNEDRETMVQYVSNSRADGILGDGEIIFHQDHTFYDPPLTAIALYAIEIPKSGSVTRFRNASTILPELPKELVERARGIRVLHLFNYQGNHSAWQDPDEAPADSPRAWQPMLWRNPETGEEALWVSPLSTVDFEGIGRMEGHQLTQTLADRAAEIGPSHTYAHQWKPNDLVLWDNRMLHHQRDPFDASEARTLRRSSIL